MKPAIKRPAPRSEAPTESAPEDLISMGYVSGAFGVRGALKVVSDTQYADSLLDYSSWWLGDGVRWQHWEVVDVTVHPKHLVATLKGLDDRDVAESLRGKQVAVPRSAMPEPDDGEFYWADLIGVSVSNVQGEALGVIESLLATGANDVLVVRDGDTERLIPFVDSVVLKVDLETRQMQVDWGLDY